MNGLAVIGLTVLLGAFLALVWFFAEWWLDGVKAARAERKAGDAYWRDLTYTVQRARQDFDGPPNGPFNNHRVES